MMTYFYYIFVFFCLLVFQTTVIPYLPVLNGFYDLFTPLVIYLGLFRPLRESIPVILILGFVMDNFTGGPLGLYLTTYIWMFAGVRWMITVLHVGDSVLMPFVVAAGVLMQNVVFIGTLTMSDPNPGYLSTAFSVVGIQVLWALLTGPVFLIVFNLSHQRWESWINEALKSRASQ
jgi:cell shape-determining protein MreD